jgi:hypothetical protein
MKKKLENSFPLTDKSKYKAQMDDIISISVNNIYQSGSDREGDRGIKSYKRFG